MSFYDVLDLIDWDAVRFFFKFGLEIWKALPARSRKRTAVVVAVPKSRPGRKRGKRKSRRKS